MKSKILVSVAAVCFVPGFVFGAETLAFAKPDVVPAPVSVTVVSTWHRVCNAEIGADIAFPAACASWGTAQAGGDVGRHWRQMGWDMKIDRYEDCGFVTEQLPSRTNPEE